MVCKVSIVIPGSPHSGAIINTTALPQVGDHLPVGEALVEVVEIKELLPSSENFHFVHVTGREIRKDEGGTMKASRPGPA
jgi:hypothetical protein